MSVAPRRPGLLVVVALLVSGIAAACTSSAANEKAGARGGYTPPVADSDVTVPVGTDATLDGSVSDPDGDPLEIRWIRTVVENGDLTSCAFSGPTAFTSVTPAGLAPTLNCTEPGRYLLQLVVNDGRTSYDDTGVIVTFKASDETGAVCSIVPSLKGVPRLRVADPESGIGSFTVLRSFNVTVMKPSAKVFSTPVMSTVIDFARERRGAGSMLLGHRNGDGDWGECVVMVRSDGTAGVLN